MADYPIQVNTVTDECGVAPSPTSRETRRRLPWMRIALCGVALTLLFGSVATLVTTRDDRRDAERQRDRARVALVSQRARTRSAEGRLEALRVGARDLNTKLPTPLATIQNLATLDVAALDVVRQLQRIGLAGDPFAYNATIDRLGALTDEYNAARILLEQQVKVLGLDTQPAPAA